MSKKICQHIRELNIYRQAKHIALYQAFNQEIDLQDIWDTAPLQGKFCYFPIITEDKLLFLPVTPKTDFIKNKYGIYEPNISREQAISIELLDIIFMPLVGFDLFGTRLGMGKGYYDRSLNINAHTQKIGVAYEFQKLDYISPDTWDIPLNMVITEEKTYSFTG